MGQDILQEIIILLAVSVIMVGLFRRLRIPPILAYLCVGALVGPYGMGWIPSTEDTHFLAEFGVVFLLFTVGLEFSLPQMMAMRATVFGLGGAQVLITSAIFGLGAWLLGASPLVAFIIGGILSLSSTAIVIKQLVEQMEMQTRHGRRAIGILLFQDLAVVPFLVIIPILAGQGNDGMLMPLLFALLKAGLIFIIMLALGRWCLRPLLQEVASAKSSELFILTVLMISLAAAWGTHAAGLSLALGGFLAGMLIGETQYRHQVESDIRPFQDVLLGLFFITVGMLIDPTAIGELLPWIALTTAVLILGKVLLIMLVMYMAGYHPNNALRTGMLLGQGSEFGFALLALATKGQLLSHSSTQVVLLSILFSMAIAPYMIRYNGKISEKFFGLTHVKDRLLTEERIATSAIQLNQHVIICGYGRVGQNLARILEQRDVPYLALDMDPVVVKDAAMAGDSVHFGDSTHRRILEASGLRNARLVVVSFNHHSAAMKVLEHCRNIHPDIGVLVRTSDDSELDTLLDAGATEVIPETVEASLLLGAYMMRMLDVSMHDILKIMQDIRSERYQVFRAYFHGERLESPADTEYVKERLYAVTLSPQADAVFRTLKDLDLEKLGVSVTAVRRGGIRGPAPEPETRLREGDVVVLYGTPDRLKRAENILLNG